jgi:hypothetical protein
MLFLRLPDSQPTPTVHYHLALSFVCAGPSQDFDCAITHLWAALKAELGEIRFWHALGLLLAATEQWDAAWGALEQGAEFGESDRGNEDEEETPGQPLSPELPPTLQQERVLARYSI